MKKQTPNLLAALSLIILSPLLVCAEPPPTPISETVWTKKIACNLRMVELQRVREKTTVAAKNGTERVVEKYVYKLALIDGAGTPEKIYDLSRARQVQMIATAYYPGDPLAWGDGTVTYTGRKMQRGIVAVDPKIIPLGTRLYISGYGYGYAADTGNAIIGNRIDLGVNNVEEEKAWMHRPVTVYILEKAATW